MKKIISLILALALCVAALATLASCAPDTQDPSKIVVGASSTPHAEILAVAKEILAEQGYELIIREFDDYVIPNTALFEGELNANYFQHQPYLTSFNKDNNMDLVSAGAIHYEPLAIYGNGITSLDALADGATIIIPTDDSNQTRALFLLAQEGLISLPEDSTVEGGVSILDITAANNPKGYNITHVEASTVPAQLKNANSGTIAVINGNYALSAGLKAQDALATEDSSGEAATTYANIVAVKPADLESAKIKALIEALKSDKVKKFIADEYAGAVVAI